MQSLATLTGHTSRVLYLGELALLAERVKRSSLFTKRNDKLNFGASCSVCAALSPDGQTVVTGAGDETLRFWNVFPSSKCACAAI